MKKKYEKPKLTETLQPYSYKAVVTSVYDGDTIHADIDLGFGTWLKDQIFRLYGIDAPEIRGSEREQGLHSRDWLRERILGKNVLIKTYKDRKGKYGRWLAIIEIDGAIVNSQIVQSGLASEY